MAEIDRNTLRRLRGIQAEKPSMVPNKNDSSVLENTSSNKNNTVKNFLKRLFFPLMKMRKKSKVLKQETTKLEKTANKGLSQEDLAQIIRQARGIGVAVSAGPVEDSNQEVYQFITPDMIDENGYLKMSMEDQKALIDGIYEFFKTGLEPSPSPQNSENSDE